MLFWFLTRKISPGCFRLEGGAGAGKGGEGGAQQGRVGTKMPPQTPKAAGAELWLVCSASPGSALLPPPVLAAPSPNGWAVKGPSWPRPPPPRGKQAKAALFGGCFPACRWVPAQPTHGSIRKALTGLSNCLQPTAALGGAAPARAPPNPNRGARALPRRHAGTCVGVLLSKGAAKPKLAAGKVRRGPGQPAPRCSNMAETKAFPPAAPVNSDTDLN